MPLLDRIMQYGVQDPKTKCVNWTGAMDGHGYGVIRIDGRNRLVTRVWYELLRGAVEGQCVLHKCDNPACFNINHLWLGTKKQNSQDMVAKGRLRGGPNNMHDTKVSDGSDT